MSKKTKKVAAKKPKKSAAKKPVKKSVKKVVKKISKLVKKAVSKKPAAKKTVAKKPAAKAKPAAKKPAAVKVVAKAKAKTINSSPKSKKSNVITMPKTLAKKEGLTKKIDLPANYKPTDKEDYMNPLQLAYFKRKLEDWKRELLMESTETIQHLQTESWNEPDPSDQATIVEQTGLELRTRDRYRKLINKIDSAIARIEQGEYGYCEVTGDPIGLKRLEARPIATMTIAAQEQHEMEERLNMEG